MTQAETSTRICDGDIVMTIDGVEITGLNYHRSERAPYPGHRSDESLSVILGVLPFHLALWTPAPGMGRE